MHPDFLGLCLCISAWAELFLWEPQHGESAYRAMPFTNDQKSKIFNHLNLALLRNSVLLEEATDAYVPGLSLTRQAKVRTYQQVDIFALLSQVEAQGEFMVNAVLAIVTELDETDELLKTAARKGGLLKADKLVLSPYDLLAQLESRRDDLLQRLRFYLGLPELPQGSDFHYGSLGRS